MNFKTEDHNISTPSFIPDSENDAAATKPDELLDDPVKAETIPPDYRVEDDRDHEIGSNSPLLPDLSKYDLTVGEALEKFPSEHRKRPSGRTLQRYCQDGRFDCYKLKTTRNGNPVHEWIIDSTSLLKFVHTKPIENASEKLASPRVDDVAIGVVPPVFSAANSSVSVAPPERVGGAEPSLVLQRSLDDKPTVTATPEETDAVRSIQTCRVELLIENAMMTAKLDAQNELIEELREDKKFMREQVIHNRQNDTLMSDMHRETLQTLKAVSIAGRHTKVEMPETLSSKESRDNFFDVGGSGQSPQKGAGDDV